MPDGEIPSFSRVSRKVILMLWPPSTRMKGRRQPPMIGCTTRAYFPGWGYMVWVVVFIEGDYGVELYEELARVRLYQIDPASGELLVSLCLCRWEDHVDCI